MSLGLRLHLLGSLRCCLSMANKGQGMHDCYVRPPLQRPLSPYLVHHTEQAPCISIGIQHL